MWKYGIKYKSNKLTHHGYHRFYDMYLNPLRHQKINFLEIGIDHKRSLNMWLDFFTNANIYGIDIGFDAIYNRGKVFRGDQSNLDDLKIVVDEIHKCQVILDDGSHVPEHQLISFNYLFKECLDYGGIYIIEDIETSYWTKGDLYGYKIKAGFKSKKNIINIFKDIIDIVNREFLTSKNLEFIKNKSKIDLDNLKYISSINFSGNCIIITKMTENDYKRYGERKYRFINKL